MNRIKTIVIIGIAAVVLLIALPDWVIKLKTNSYIYNDVNHLPKQKVGLLLGTSKYVQSGRVNLYYQYRISAAIKLYEHRKIDFILISGDNGQVEYNEPQTIKKDLIAAGIPENKIFLDYAGFRTWDSIIRAKKVFGQTNFVVISQRFHNQRAIFIAQHYQMNVVGFDAHDVSTRYGIKTRVREKFARIKLMLDILIDKKPKYLGKEIVIE